MIWLLSSSNSGLSLATTMPSSWSMSPASEMEKLTIVIFAVVSGGKWGFFKRVVTWKFRENIILNPLLSFFLSFFLSLSLIFLSLFFSSFSVSFFSTFYILSFFLSSFHLSFQIIFVVSLEIWIKVLSETSIGRKKEMTHIHPEVLWILDGRFTELDANRSSLLERLLLQQRLQGRIERLAHVLQQHRSPKLFRQFNLNLIE